MLKSKIAAAINWVGAKKVLYNTASIIIAQNPDFFKTAIATSATLSPVCPFL